MDSIHSWPGNWHLDCKELTTLKQFLAPILPRGGMDYVYGGSMQLVFSDQQIKDHFAKSLCSPSGQSSMQAAVRIAKLENPNIAILEDRKGDEIQTFVLEEMQEDLWRRPAMRAEVQRSIEEGERFAKIGVTVFLNAIRDYMRSNRIESDDPPVNYGIKTLQQLAEIISLSNHRTTITELPDAPIFNIIRIDKIQSRSAVERQMRRWEKDGKITQPDLKIDGSAEEYFKGLVDKQLFRSSGIVAMMTLIPYRLYKKIPADRRWEYEIKYSVRLIPEFTSWNEEIEFGIESGSLYRDESGCVQYVPDEFEIKNAT